MPTSTEQSRHRADPGRNSLRHGLPRVDGSVFDDAGLSAPYLEGLRAYGWRGDDKDVRFAAAASGALQTVSFAAFFIARLGPEFGEVQPWPEEMAEEQSSDVDAVMDTWCETFRFLLTLGERATRSVVDG